MSATQRFARPVSLNRLEAAVIAVLVTISLVLGWYGVNRRVRQAHERFLRLAPEITQALERYAADHGGRYPYPVPPTQRPVGLSDRYIKWDPAWGIVYDTRAARRGTYNICLELLVPNRKSNFRRLCVVYRHLRRHGRAQPIPGTNNRLWVVRRNGKRMPPPAAAKPKP